MPRELPGFYWDESRNRYFPLSSRPGVPTASGTSGHTTQHPPFRGGRPGPEHADDISCELVTPEDKGRLRKRRRLNSEKMKVSLGYADRSRLAHGILAENIASRARGLTYHLEYPVSYSVNLSAFQVIKQSDGTYAALVGDQGGGLQIFQTDATRAYTKELSLHLASEVVDVCMTATRRLAVSFGPSCEIAVQAVATPDYWSVMRTATKDCHDVRSAHWLNNSVVLGAARRGIYLPDIEASGSFDVLQTGSDVLAVHQLEHVIYAGARNGTVKLFDKRLDTVRKGQDLLNSRYHSTNSSITHLSVVNQWQLLVSTIRGDLETHDLRFARRTTPLMHFSGHANAYSTKLGIAVSPCHSFLFAAGQDNRVRGWSMRTGQSLTPPTPPTPSSTPLDHPRLFRDPFPASIPSMQVTDGGFDSSGAGDSGLTLWAVAGSKVYRYWLGQEDVGHEIVTRHQRVE